VIGAKDAREDPHVVTGTFLLNNSYASILFNTRADRSFVSFEFASMICLKPISMPDAYEIELADGKLVMYSNVVPDCTLYLHDHLFSIDLSMELGSFDIIVGMDWLVKNKAEIVCHERLVRIPLAKDETPLVQGERPGKQLRIFSCMRARRYLRKKCQALVAHVSERRPKE
jgi:hypothetical protein